MKTINDYIIKLGGKVSILEPLEIDNNYNLKLDCSVVAENLKTNEDGTYNIEYKVEPLRVEMIDKTGKSLKAKDPRSFSQKLRSLCVFEVRSEQGDEQLEYEHFGAWFLRNFTLIWNLYKKDSK